MKIGIVTYHRTLNYGACLQAIALRIALEQLGHETYYVDYWPKYHKQTYEAFSFGRFLSLGHRSRIYYLLESIQWYQYRKMRIRNFENFFAQYIYPYCKPTDEQFDIIVYGSDQIWRKQDALKGYNPVYFGQNEFRTNEHVSYSASMGILPKTETEKQEVKEMLSHLDKIAVREKNLLSMLQELGYKETSLTLDPTLLLTAEEWDRVIPTTEEKGDKYILVYGIGKVAFNMEYIYAFAKKHNYKVRILSGTASAEDTYDKITTAAPDSFIQLIKNAEFVFTSSFHGLAFSIIYGKQFYASYSTNSNRAQTLLEFLGIKDRLLTKGTPIPDNSTPIDFLKVNEKLVALRDNSLTYLKSL